MKCKGYIRRKKRQKQVYRKYYPLGVFSNLRIASLSSWAEVTATTSLMPSGSGKRGRSLRSSSRRMGRPGRTIFSDFTTDHSWPRMDCASTTAASTMWATHSATAWSAVAAVSTENSLPLLRAYCQAARCFPEQARQSIRRRSSFIFLGRCRRSHPCCHNSYSALIFDQKQSFDFKPGVVAH